MSAVLKTTHEEWLQQRRRGIGGSDAAAVLGLSKWSTPLQVYYQKLGEAPPIPESEPMRWGKLLEPVLRQEYADQTGREILMTDGVITSEQHPFMLASLDGFTRDDRIVELKTARSGDGWGDANDDIPTEYLIQVQHYMAVTGYEVADVAVLIGGSDFRIYEVPADKDLQTMMIEREAQFWQRVEQERPPEPVSVADLMAFYAVKPGNVHATPEIVQLVSELKALRSNICDLEISKESLENEIKLFLGDRDTLLDANGKALVTWKQAKAPIKFDTKRFQDEQPVMYSQYCVEGMASRRFLVK